MSSKAAKRSKAEERAARAAELLAERRRTERRRQVLMISGVVAAMVLIIGGVVLVQQLTKSEVQPTATGYSLAVGPGESAPHEVVVYEDFLCPICGVFERRAGERLSELADQGLVTVEYRPISILSRISPYSEDAANAFFVVREAAGDDVAKEFHDLLFANQPSESGPFPSNDDLVDLAVEAGANEDDVRDGIENGDQADAVQAATQEATDAGVEGTPTVLLDGEQFSDGGSWEEIADNLVAAVQQQDGQ